MLFSLIIPTYNEEKNISRLLERLESFALPAEIIVCDGGSDDGTINTIKNNFSQVKLLQTDKGRGQQMDAATVIATGDIYVFIHADSILEQEYFIEVEQAVKRGASWGSGKVIFDNPQRIYRRIERCSNLRASILHACYGDQAIFCTKELYYKIGGFKPMFFLEDLEFSKRAAAAAPPVIVDSEIITSSRRYEKQGVYRTICRMQTVKLLYSLGFSLERIWQFYVKE